MMLGASVSLIVIVKVQPLVFPELSVARQVTRFVPLSKVEPLGGVQTNVTPGQLSAAVVVKSTLLRLHWPGSVLATILGEQMILGASVSLIVTVNEQPLVFPELSVARQVTRFVPLLKVEPLGGVQTNVIPGQLSATVVV